MPEKLSVVLLPGLNGTEGLFKPLIDSAPTEYNVVAISYPTQQKLSYSELKNIVLEKVSQMEPPFILVGESFSGPLSLMVSQEKPKGLIGIVMVATFITAPNLAIGRFLPWRFGFQLTKPLYKIRLFISNRDSANFINAISTELQKVSTDVLADRIQSIFAVNAKQALIDCDIPLVYFRGTKDFVVPQRNVNQIKALKPDIAVVNFKTQHFLLQSKPELAWKAISTFIENSTSLKDQLNR